jgi:hypothetical protein
MLSPTSGWVLGAGVVIASPALHAALVSGTLSLETAAVRLLVAVLVSWVGLSMLASLVDQTSAPVETEAEPLRSLPGVDGPLPVRAAVLDPTDPAPRL